MIQKSEDAPVCVPYRHDKQWDERKAFNRVLQGRIDHVCLNKAGPKFRATDRRAGMRRSPPAPGPAPTGGRRATAPGHKSRPLPGCRVSQGSPEQDRVDAGIGADVGAVEGRVKTKNQHETPQQDGGANSGERCGLLPWRWHPPAQQQVEGWKQQVEVLLNRQRPERRRARSRTGTRAYPARLENVIIAEEEELRKPAPRRRCS